MPGAARPTAGLSTLYLQLQRTPVKCCGMNFFIQWQSFRQPKGSKSLSNLPKRYNFYTIMVFEFDEPKSQGNLKKHGIDFVDAQALWSDPDMLEIPAKTTDEPRFLIVGRISGKHWSAVATPRGDNIRIISVRRSRIEEVAIYEG